MSRRVWIVVILILAAAFGAVALWMADREEIDPKPVTTAVGQVPAGMPVDIPADETGLERLPPPDALPAEAEEYPQHFQDLEGKAAEEPEEIPTTIEYPRLEKLASKPLSEVPHQVIGAWDEDQASSTPGKRRAFVVVVEPGLADSELEMLARDIWHQNRDAAILDVSIYDSERAATRARALDGGALAFQHLVAEVKRNEGLSLDVIRVHGRRIEP